MALKNKIDSNDTSLAYAEEASLGVLSTPTWYSLAPNSYGDFGGEIAITAPNPITNTRQRQKGVTTDLDANGSFNHNYTFSNLRDMLQGFMFADERTTTTLAMTGASSGNYTLTDTTGLAIGDFVKITGFTNAGNNGAGRITALVASTSITVDGLTPVDETIASTVQLVGQRQAAGDVDVDASGALPTLTSTTLDFTTLGLVPGQWIYIGGDAAGTSFTTAANNGFKRIRSIAANVLTIDKSDTTMATEASTTETIELFWGSVLKNESDPTLIVRRSYTIERILGAPDDVSANVQSEALVGAVPSELVWNVPQAALSNMDLNFVAIDNSQQTAGNELQTSLQNWPVKDAINTSSDFTRLKMALVSSADENPTALFAYVTEATITINNNLSVNKAVAVLGGFDVTAGTFAVSASVTAYFQQVEAVQAVRNNSDVTFDLIIAKDNEGVVFDMPLLALGDGRANVEIDQPITLPLSMDAATASKIDASNLDFTAMFTFFDYLPDAATV